MAANLCTFDSTLTAFDSTLRTFDQTTCGAAVVQTSGAPPAGRSRKRKYVIAEEHWQQILAESFGLDAKALEAPPETEKAQERGRLVRRLGNAPKVAELGYKQYPYTISLIGMIDEVEVRRMVAKMAEDYARMLEDDDEDVLLLTL